jgi:hypothetical protein
VPTVASNITWNSYPVQDPVPTVASDITWNSYPVQDPVPTVATEMIPVELDSQNDCKTQECQATKDGNENVIPLHILLVCTRYRSHTDNG